MSVFVSAQSLHVLSDEVVHPGAHSPHATAFGCVPSEQEAFHDNALVFATTPYFSCSSTREQL